MTDLASENLAAADAQVRRIKGPTILMGDGSYYDYEDPASTSMTIEDYAWGIAGTNRFRCQTRARLWGGVRCLYNVAQHVVLLAIQMERDGCSREDCLAGLMHESGEVPWGDMPGPAKPLLQGFKAMEQLHGAAIDKRFDVPAGNATLVKRYDIRMLATEKRDLMPHGQHDEWSWTRGYEPFDFEIVPWSGEYSAHRFLQLHEALSQ